MAKVKIQGHASGTGVVTVTAPNTSTDRTITLPDSTATIATTTDVAARLPSITDNGNANAITIDSSENVGIGNASPSTTLDVQAAQTNFDTNVYGNIRVNSTTAFDATPRAGIVFSVKYSSTQNANGSSIQGYKENSTTGDFGQGMLFTTQANGAAPAENLRITSDGRGLSQFTAKAWANFNGQGTPAFRDSHNCSSITDNGTGDYTINFTNNMANVTYSTVGSAGSNGTDVVNDLHAMTIGSCAVGSVRVGDNYANGGSVRDPDICNLIVFGD
jgi:hypothetical protein